MRIGIISDTHGSLPAKLPSLFAGVEHIVHAGDIGGQFVLDELELIAPVTAVLGNCDYAGDYHDIRAYANLKLANTRFYIAHTPVQITAALAGKSNIDPGGLLPHIAIHGHTHVPRDEVKGAVRWICPGSILRPRDEYAPTVMILELEDSSLPRAYLVECV